MLTEQESTVEVLNKVTRILEKNVGFFSLTASHWRSIVRKFERGEELSPDECKQVVSNVRRWL